MKLAKEQWRALAAEALAFAVKLTDPEAKRMMLAIAAGYERLAQRAEEREKETGSER